MWEQWWVVHAQDGGQAVEAVSRALTTWAPSEAGYPEVTGARIYRGPDDLAITEDLARELSEIRQTVATAHRQELARRLKTLKFRARGIPPQSGWVVLDGLTPRSPRPLDVRDFPRPRWVVTVRWPGQEPTL
ncbi:MAG: hypothetical protein OWU33_10855 [Firmicutes bacterium]|nr:hypothetical protein [Bacillota bacterium]